MKMQIKITSSMWDIYFQCALSIEADDRRGKWFVSLLWFISRWSGVGQKPVQKVASRQLLLAAVAGFVLYLVCCVYCALCTCEGDEAREGARGGVLMYR